MIFTFTYDMITMMSLSIAFVDDFGFDGHKAAVAYALHLAHNSRHDLPTAMISLHPHETAWNTKSVGMNNAGF